MRERGFAVGDSLQGWLDLLADRFRDSRQGTECKIAGICRQSRESNRKALRSRWLSRAGDRNVDRSKVDARSKPWKEPLKNEHPLAFPTLCKNRGDDCVVCATFAGANVQIVRIHG